MLEEFIPVFGNTLPVLASGLASGVFNPKLLPSPAGVPKSVDKSNSGFSRTGDNWADKIFRASSRSCNLSVNSLALTGSAVFNASLISAISASSFNLSTLPNSGI